MGPVTVRSPTSAGANATGNGGPGAGYGVLRTPTLASSAPPHYQASHDPDERTEKVVRKEPAGPGALVVVRKEPAGPGALVVVGLHVTTGQGLPGSRKAWRAGPVPVWHSRVVSGARASARAGNALPKQPHGYAGWCRRPGFGPGRERFAYPPPPFPLSPYQILP